LPPFKYNVFHDEVFNFLHLILESIYLAVKLINCNAPRYEFSHLFFIKSNTKFRGESFLFIKSSKDCST
jgi:hypothetical protein